MAIFRLQLGHLGQRLLHHVAQFGQVRQLLARLDVQEFREIRLPDDFLGVSDGPNGFAFVNWILDSIDSGDVLLKPNSCTPKSFRDYRDTLGLIDIRAG